MTRTAKRRKARIPRVVSAHYDRKAGRIVVHLSSRLIASFSPADAEGLKAPSLRSSRKSRSVDRALTSAFRRRVRTSTCPASWSVSWAPKRGWRPGWVRGAASRGAERRRLPPERMENLGAGQRRLAAPVGPERRTRSSPHISNRRGPGRGVASPREATGGGPLAARLLPAERATLDNLKGTQRCIVDHGDDRRKVVLEDR